jgi:predicted ester cyclase
MSAAVASKSWTLEERIRAQRECVQLHVTIENAHEIDRILPDTFARDGIYYDVVPGMVHYAGASGGQGIRAFYDMLFDLLPDIHIRFTHEYDVPGYCVREGVVTGTHSAEFAGIPASGRKIVLPFVGIYIFGDDPTRMISERAYWDNDGLMRQMRGELVCSADLPWHHSK